MLQAAASQLFPVYLAKYIAVLSDDESEDCADVDPPPRHHPVSQVEPIPHRSPKAKDEKGLGIWVAERSGSLVVKSSRMVC